MSRSVSSLLIVAAVFGSAAVTAEDRKAAFNVCTACHLPSGQGVPGAFPPIAERTAKIAALEGGREYLIGTVLYGLMGPINVAGQPYVGVMASQSGVLDHAGLASALNYAVFELSTDGVDLNPFTADEVKQVADKWGAAGPGKTAEVRKAMLERFPDDWPG